MNFLSLFLGLLPSIVHGIQAVVGDKASGATKAQMAKDALAVATGAAGNVLGGGNATYAAAASQIAGLAIDQTVAIAKATGTYQEATEIAAAAQQDVNVANAVTQLIQSVQQPKVVQGTAGTGQVAAAAPVEIQQGATKQQDTNQAQAPAAATQEESGKDG